MPSKSSMSLGELAICKKFLDSHREYAIGLFSNVDKIRQWHATDCPETREGRSCLVCELCNDDGLLGAAKKALVSLDDAEKLLQQVRASLGKSVPGRGASASRSQGVVNPRFLRGQGHPVEKPCSETIWQRPYFYASSRWETLSDHSTQGGKHAFRVSSRPHLRTIRFPRISTRIPMTLTRTGSGILYSRATRVQGLLVPRLTPNSPLFLLAGFRRPRRVLLLLGLSFSGGACRGTVLVRLTDRALVDRRLLQRSLRHPRIPRRRVRPGRLQSWSQPLEGAVTMLRGLRP